MPRGKRIVIEKVIKDPVVSRLKSMKISDMKSKRAHDEKGLHENISDIVGRANDLYTQDKLEKEKLKGMGLFTIEEAFEKLEAAYQEALPEAKKAFEAQRQAALQRIIQAPSNAIQ